MKNNGTGQCLEIAPQSYYPNGDAVLVATFNSGERQLLWKSGGPS